MTHYKEYTIIPIVRVLRVMQDFVHQQYVLLCGLLRGL